MAITSLDIVNTALVKLGNKRITTLDEGTDAADKAKGEYKQAINYVISLGRFSAATWTMKLSADASFGIDLTTTTDLYPYRYELPNDLIDLLAVFDGTKDVTHDYQLEGNFLLTSHKVLYVRYLRNIVGTGLIGPELAEAISAWLAFQLSYSITGSVQNRAQLQEGFERSFRTARTADARRKAPINYIDNAIDDESHTFLRSRMF